MADEKEYEVEGTEENTWLYQNELNRRFLRRIAALEEAEARTSVSADAAMNARVRCLEVAAGYIHPDGSFRTNRMPKDIVGLAHQFYRYASTGEYPFAGEVPIIFDPDYVPERTVEDSPEYEGHVLYHENEIGTKPRWIACREPSGCPKKHLLGSEM